MSTKRTKLKIVMLGEGRVGKTSLLNRFINNAFDAECPSTQNAKMYASSKMEVAGQVVDVAVWDTAGQERYHALGPIYYRDSHGAVLVYDITDKESFSKVRVWLRELHQVVGENIAVVVVGNKCDLERERKVRKDEAENWCLENGCAHFLCSAKLGMKVADAYQTVVTRALTNMQHQGGSGSGAGGLTGDASSGSYGPSGVAPSSAPSGGGRRGLKVTLGDENDGRPGNAAGAKKEDKPCCGGGGK